MKGPGVWNAGTLDSLSRRAPAVRLPKVEPTIKKAPYVPACGAVKEKTGLLEEASEHLHFTVGLGTVTQALSQLDSPPTPHWKKPESVTQQLLPVLVNHGRKIRDKGSWVKRESFPNPAAGQGAATCVLRETGLYPDNKPSLY
jgi:hypothetical protein